jgi:hypothetical protein
LRFSIEREQRGGAKVRKLRKLINGMQVDSFQQAIELDSEVSFVAISATKPYACTEAVRSTDVIMTY